MFTLFRRISKVAILKLEPARTLVQRTTTWVWKRGSSMCSVVWRESFHELCRKICPMNKGIKKLSSRNPWNRKNVSLPISSIVSLLIARFYNLLLRKGRTELGDVTPHNIKQLKKLNSVVFPVSYNDKVS